MRLIFAAVLIAISAIVPALRAQDATRPTVELAPKKPARPSPTVIAEPAAPDLPELSQLDEMFKQTSLGKTADQYRLHAEWRRLRNQVTNKPDVVAARKAAEAARTDLEKRKLLIQYYNLCYVHMQALAQAPDVKAGLEDMRQQHLASFDQPRVRPTASPSASPAEGATGSTPSPTPTPSPEDEPATSD